MGRLTKEKLPGGTKVATRLSPFVDPVIRYSPSGCTIRQIVEFHRAGSGAVVFVNGERVPKCMWDRIRPKANATVTVSLVSGGGGGGKNPLRIVLTIAVIAAAAYLGPALAAQMGFTGAATATTAAGATIGGLSAATSAAIVGGVISGVVTMAGGVLVNALAPASSGVQGGYEGSFAAGTTTATQYTITGAQNKANQYGPIPRVFGRRRVYPVYAAVPYDETVGNDQYVRMLFSFGAGPLDLSDFRIGETPLSLFEGVETEIRYGYADDAPIKLYANTVHEDSLSTRLYSGVPRTFESQNDADELSFDIGFTGLVKFDSNAKRSRRTVEFRVEYRKTTETEWRGYRQITAPDVTTTAPVTNPGSYEWVGWGHGTHDLDAEGNYYLKPSGPYAWVVEVTPSRIISAGTNFASANMRVGDTIVLVDGPNPGPHLVTAVSGNEVRTSSILSAGAGITATCTPIVVVTAATDQAYKHNIRIVTNDRAKYQVRITRLTADNTSTSVRDEAYFSVLRTITYSPPVGSGIDECLVALRIKASGQLNGTISNFSAIAEALLPGLDDDLNWTAPRKTRNPADAALEVLRGSLNVRPVADNRIVLSAFKDWADFCNELDQNGEPRFVYDAVIDGMTTVDQLVRAIMGSARANISRPGGKISVVVDRLQTTATQLFTARDIQSFKLKRAFYDMPHGLRVRFVNPDKGWVQDEVVVYADGYDSTNATLFETLELPGVCRASQAWRDGRFHLAAAIARPNEYEIVCDINHLACERGRKVRVQHDVTRWGLGTGRVVSRVIDGDGNLVSLTFDEFLTVEAGKSYSLRCRLSTGDLILLALKDVSPSQETTTVGVLGTLSAEDGPQVGDLCAFGETGKDTVALIVKYINRQGDLSASVICVDEAPSIHSADTGPLPSFDTQASWPGQGVIQQSPQKPVIDLVQSDETVMVYTSAGYLPAVRFSFGHISSNSVQRDYLQARWRRYETGDAWNYQVFPGAPDQITIAGVDEQETYEFEFRYTAGASLASAWTPYGPYVVVGRSTPPSDVFGLQLVQNQLIWQYGDRPVDFAGFRVVYNFGRNTARSGAIEAHPGTLLDVASFPVTSIPVTEVTFLVVAVDTMGNESVIPATRTVDLRAYLPGRFGDIVVANIVETVDMLDETQYAGDTTEFWGADADPFWGADADPFWLDTVYAPLVVTRSVTAPAEWTPAQMTLAWQASSGSVVDYQRTGFAEFWGADTDPFWGADTDPFWVPDGPFAPWPGSAYVDDWHSVTIRVTTPGGSTQGEVSQIRALFDVPDISEDLTNVAISETGTRLALTKPFRVIKMVGNITLLQDGGTAQSVIVDQEKSATLGPLVFCKDISGAYTSGTIDCTVKGY